MDFETELKLSFLDEASQSLTDVEQCFLDLENNPSDSDTLNKIFRLAHNLKGSSKAVGFDEFGAFTHEFESFILKIKKGELICNAEVMNILLQTNDHVKMMVDELKININATFNSSALLQQLINYKQRVNETTKTASEEKLALVQPATYEPSIEEILAAELAKEEALVSDRENHKNNSTLNSVPASYVTSPQKSTKSNDNKSVTVEESLRVSTSKIESLLNNVGEMVILQSVLSRQVSLTKDEELKKTVQLISKISKQIQDNSMSLRMTPIKPIFQKMQRIVRDTSMALDKNVNLVLSGENTEIDKSVLEKISDPLVHIIRNSVDHGIENKEQRLINQKNETGTVLLSAFHQSGMLVIEITDDGGGLSPIKLKNKAIEKNIIKVDAQLSDEECYNLIFAAGFSTKEVVTDVSGRGVGMDVVKTNITQLSGSVKIKSELNKGTTFTITLPLTMAIIDSLVVSYSDQKFAIPLNQVHETLKPKSHQIQKNKNFGETLMIRDESISMYRLGDFFGLKNSKETEDLIGLIFRTPQENFCLMVDDIIQNTQVVTKQLGPELQGLKGISGSTILGDGQAALILEPNDVLKRKYNPQGISHSVHKNTLIDKITTKDAA